MKSVLIGLLIGSMIFINPVWAWFDSETYPYRMEIVSSAEISNLWISVNGSSGINGYIINTPNATAGEKNYLYHEKEECNPCGIIAIGNETEPKPWVNTTDLTGYNPTAVYDESEALVVAHFDDGVLLQDATVNGNDGTASDTVVDNSSNVQWMGGNIYLDLGESISFGDLPLTGNFTVIVQYAPWTLVDNCKFLIKPILPGWTGPSYFVYQLAIDDGGTGKLRVDAKYGEYVASNFDWDDYDMNEFHQVGVGINGSINVIVDGAVDASADGNGYGVNASSEDDSIVIDSGQGLGTTYSCPGTVDEYMVWNRFLSNDELAHINNQPTISTLEATEEPPVSNSAPYQVEIKTPTNNTINNSQTINLNVYVVDDAGFSNLTIHNATDGAIIGYNSSVIINGTNNLVPVAFQEDGTHLVYANASDNGSPFLINTSVNHTVRIDTTSPISTFLRQEPSDLNTLNAVESGINISYNITDALNEVNGSSIVLYFKSNSSTESANYHINGTATTGWISRAGTNLTEDTVWNFSLDDNDIYHGHYNLPEDEMEDLGHSTIDLDKNTEYVKVELFNMSNTSDFNVVEIMVQNQTASSGSLRFYYCNSSSPTPNNPPIDSNCANFYNLPASQGYNHTHTVNSSHVIAPLGLNKTSGQIGGVEVTKTSYFLMRGINGPNAWDVSYIDTVSRTDAIQTTQNNGVSWSDFSGTVDLHVHQFKNDSTLYYFVGEYCDVIGNCGNASLITDSIESVDIPPSSPDVYAPETGTYNGNITINYTASIASNGHNISYYNITLVNTTESFIVEIQGNNSRNLSFIWDSSPILDGEYFIKVVTTDTAGQVSFGLSENITIDNSPPIIITNISNTSYSYTNFTIQFNATDQGIGTDVCWYNNNTDNSTPQACNFTISKNYTSDGPKNITFYANDTGGLLNTTLIYFSVDRSQPSISTNLSNLTYWYQNFTVQFNSTDLHIDTLWHNNGSDNLTFQTGNHTFTINYTSDGPKNITFYANDTAGNLNSSVVYFTVDTTPPIISGISISDETGSSAMVMWSTNELSNSSVHYGIASGTYTGLVESSASVMLHEIVLGGLSPEIIYYFIVNSSDAVGNMINSTEYIITTPTYSSARSFGTSPGVSSEAVVNDTVVTASLPDVRFSGKLISKTFYSREGIKLDYIRVVNLGADTNVSLLISPELSPYMESSFTTDYSTFENPSVLRYGEEKILIVKINGSYPVQDMGEGIRGHIRLFYDGNETDSISINVKRPWGYKSAIRPLAVSLDGFTESDPEGPASFITYLLGMVFSLGSGMFLLIKSQGG